MLESELGPLVSAVPARDCLLVDFVVDWLIDVSEGWVLAESLELCVLELDEFVSSASALAQRASAPTETANNACFKLN